MTRQRRNELFTAALLIAPAFLIMAVVTVYPLLSSLEISLRQVDLKHPELGQAFIGLDNYRATLADPIFWASARVTLLFVVLAVTLEISLGLLCALLLNREFKGRAWVRALALLPWAVPAVVNGIMWKWMLNPSYGALNGFLYQLGLIKTYIIWLGQPLGALLMVVVADAWKETPFIMLLFLAALQAIPADLYDAARVDGATGRQAFLKLTLPLLRPTLFVALALRTIWALKSFDLIYTLTAGGPSNGTMVLGYYTYIKSFVALQLGRGAAVAYVMTLAVTLLVLFYQRTLYREVEY